MARRRLDKIDRKILNKLQEDGRTPNIELAKMAGISAPPCLRRLRNLEEDGIIVNYTTVLNHAACGYGFEALVLVKANISDSMNGQIRDWRFVRAAKMLTGEYDYILTVRCKDHDEFKQYFELIAKCELVERITVMTVLSQVMSDHGIDLKPDEIIFKH